MAGNTADAGQDHAGVDPGPEAPDEILRSYLWSVADALVRQFVTDCPPAAPPGAAGAIRRGPALSMRGWLLSGPPMEPSTPGMTSFGPSATPSTLGTPRENTGDGTGANLLPDRPASRQGRRGTSRPRRRRCPSP